LLRFDQLGQSHIAFGKDETGFPLMPLWERLRLLQPRRGAVAVFTSIPAIGHGIGPQKTESWIGRSPIMDARELRALAEHYKRMASLVTDEDISKALLELAAKYEAMAKSLRIKPPDRRE
jgi:hypothetical protein